MDKIFFQIVRDVGPIVGVIVFFIWRDWKRESQLFERIKKLEDYQREILISLIEKGTTALVQSTEVIKWVGRVMDRVSTKCPYITSPPQEMPQQKEFSSD